MRTAYTTPYTPTIHCSCPAPAALALMLFRNGARVVALQEGDRHESRARVRWQQQRDFIAHGARDTAPPRTDRQQQPGAARGESVAHGLDLLIRHSRHQERVVLSPVAEARPLKRGDDSTVGGKVVYYET